MYPSLLCTINPEHRKDAMGDIDGHRTCVTIDSSKSIELYWFDVLAFLKFGPMAAVRSCALCEARWRTSSIVLGRYLPQLSAVMGHSSPFREPFPPSLFLPPQQHPDLREKHLPSPDINIVHHPALPDHHIVHRSALPHDDIVHHPSLRYLGPLHSSITYQPNATMVRFILSGMSSVPATLSHPL
jgi:hypothetical protein